MRAKRRVEQKGREDKCVQSIPHTFYISKSQISIRTKYSGEGLYAYRTRCTQIATLSAYPWIFLAVPLAEAEKGCLVDVLKALEEERSSPYG